jgi:hypothetical protein
VICREVKEQRPYRDGKPSLLPVKVPVGLKQKILKYNASILVRGK